MRGPAASQSSWAIHLLEAGQKREAPLPLAVADVPAPVPSEEVIGHGREAVQAVRAGAGEDLWAPGVGVLGAAGCAAAGRGGVRGRGVAGPLLCRVAVGRGVQSRGWAVGQRGERRQLRRRAAGGERAGQVSQARGSGSLQGERGEKGERKRKKKEQGGLGCDLGSLQAPGEWPGPLHCCPALTNSNRAAPCRTSVGSGEGTSPFLQPL